MLSIGFEKCAEVQAYLDTVIGDFDLKYIPSTGEYVEIINKEFDKGKGLRKLAGLLGADGNRVFAVGDGENDLEMLEAASLAFVPANGCMAAKAKKHVDVPSNDEFAVAHAIDYIESVLC